MPRAIRISLLLAAVLLLIIPPRARPDSVSYSYDDAGRLIRASYGSGKTILYTYDNAGNLLRRLVTTVLPGPAPVTSAAGVVNAASFLGGGVAAGEIEIGRAHV